MTRALDVAIQRWRVQAWSVVNDHSRPMSLRMLAWRFLKTHGVV